MNIMPEKFESPNSQSPTRANECEKKLGKLSRREFLKQTGGAIAWSALPLVALLGEIPRAWSKEVKEGDSWLEGLHALRDDVFHSDVESMAIFIKDNAGNSSWKRFTRGTIDGITVPYEIIEEEIFGENQEIKLAHTHPLATFKKKFTELAITPQDIRNMQTRKMPPPIAPPSVDDITAIMTLFSTFEPGYVRNKFSELIIDARGVWEYTPDMNHDFYKTYTKYKEKLHKQFATLTDDTEVLNILRENPSIATRGTLLKYLQTSERKRLSPQIQNLVTEIVIGGRVFKKRINPLHEATLESTKKSYKTGEIDVGFLRKLYGKFGIDLSFASFEKLGIK